MDITGTYDFLLETYETEILKTIGIWGAFPDSALDFRPHAKSRTVLEQMEHQCQSEDRWMRTMMNIATGDPMPLARTRRAFLDKYLSDAKRRLGILHTKADTWWREPVAFFDVTRSRTWVMVRRLNHSTHHRGQLIVYLRLLDLKVPSVYGPTADTGDTVIYSF
jgi:uncharacterized damage-inducible protein DinB